MRARGLAARRVQLALASLARLFVMTVLAQVGQDPRPLGNGDGQKNLALTIRWSNPATPAATSSAGPRGGAGADGTPSVRRRGSYSPRRDTPAPRCRAPAPARARSRGVSRDRKSTRLNSSHMSISYAVFCLKKKKKKNATKLLTLLQKPPKI